MKGWEQWTNGSIERDMKDLEIAHLYFEELTDKHVFGTPYGYLTCRGKLLANIFFYQPYGLHVILDRNLRMRIRLNRKVVHIGKPGPECTQAFMLNMIVRYIPVALSLKVPRVERTDVWTNMWIWLAELICVMRSSDATSYL